MTACNRMLAREGITPSLQSSLRCCWPTCRNRYTDVVLVIMFNVAFPGWLEVQKQLRAAYTPLFRQIVYTGFHHQVTCPSMCILVCFGPAKSGVRLATMSEACTSASLVPSSSLGMTRELWKREPLSTSPHLQEGFPEEDTWVSCDGGHHGFYMYQCFSNVLQVRNVLCWFHALP